MHKSSVYRIAESVKPTSYCTDLESKSHRRQRRLLQTKQNGCSIKQFDVSALPCGFRRESHAKTPSKQPEIWSKWCSCEDARWVYLDSPLVCTQHGIFENVVAAWSKPAAGGSFLWPSPPERRSWKKFLATHQNGFCAPALKLCKAMLFSSE